MTNFLISNDRYKSLEKQSSHLRLRSNPRRARISAVRITFVNKSSPFHNKYIYTYVGLIWFLTISILSLKFRLALSFPLFLVQRIWKSYICTMYVRVSNNIFTPTPSTYISLKTCIAFHACWIVSYIHVFLCIILKQLITRFYFI